MKCPRCGKELEESSSPFSDGGDFYFCNKCGAEGYGCHEADGSYHVSFTIPFEESIDEENEV